MTLHMHIHLLVTKQAEKVSNWYAVSRVKWKITVLLIAVNLLTK